MQDNLQMSCREGKAFDKNKNFWHVVLLIVSALPAIFIEILALIGFADIDLEANFGRILAVHIIALVTLLAAVLRPKLHITLKLIPVVLAPFAAFFIVENMTHDPVTDMKTGVIFLNIAFFVIALITLTFIIGRTGPAVVAVVVLTILFGLVNYYTLKFRGTPLFPWDLASAGIAADVLGGYSLTLTPELTLIISIAVLFCVLSAVYSIRVKFRLKPIRPIIAALCCVLMFTSCGYIQTDKAISDFNLYPYLFTPTHLYKTNGFAASFLMNLRYAKGEKPDGYAPSELNSIAAQYASDSAADVTSKPNVIVIMNESFADMKDLVSFSTNAQYLPFINSLEENTVKGKVHVSVKGGNTPNSEFEFLTGLTMGYLPSGSIPYQQYIKTEKTTLVEQFKDLGYSTVAMHPYGASGWDRDEIYKLFGFDEMYFKDSAHPDFAGKDTLRKYISDSGLYSKIYDVYEAKDENEPLFVFAVTMQNHSGYSDKNTGFTPYINVRGLEKNYSVSTYMSLVRESDKAFEELVEYFSQVEEDTVILMFGDHQPNDSIATPLMNKAGVKYDDNDLETSENRYVTPYVLWANYDIDEKEVGDISLNYLSTVLMETANLPMTASQKMLSGLMEKYPIITGRCIIDVNGTTYPVIDYTFSKDLVEYAKIQYSYMFDEKNLPKGYYTLAE